MMMKSSFIFVCFPSAPLFQFHVLSKKKKFGFFFSSTLDNNFFFRSAAEIYVKFIGASSASDTFFHSKWCTLTSSAETHKIIDKLEIQSCGLFTPKSLNWVTRKIIFSLKHDTRQAQSGLITRKKCFGWRPRVRFLLSSGEDFAIFAFNLKICECRDAYICLPAAVEAPAQLFRSQIVCEVELKVMAEQEKSWSFSQRVKGDNLC